VRRRQACRAAITLTALAVLVTAALTARTPIARAADGHELTGLVVGEASVWHTDDRFDAFWDPMPPGTVTAYGVLDAAGREIPGYWGTTTEASISFRVPPTPGVYILEAWHAGGQPVREPLYFDDAHPGPVGLTAPIWTAAGQDIPVRISLPAPPFPVSGIAGYAVTLDSQKDGAPPCASIGRCGPGDIAVPGIATSPQIRFPSPPEGISYVHALSISVAGLPSTVATARVGIDGTPPEVHLEGVPGGWATGPVRVTAVAADPLSGMAAAGPDGPITALAIDGGPPQIAPGSSVTVAVSGEGTHRLEFYGRDAVGNSGDGSLPFARPGAATVQIDEGDPSVAFAAPDPSDPERIEATVADALSGPDPDRGTIGVRPVGSSASFQPLATDARRGHLVARWSSDDFPRGPYEFRATGFDLAGNSTASRLDAHGDPFVLRNPVKREARLAFGFGGASLVFQRCARADGSRTCHRAVVRSFAKRPAARTLPCCHGAVVGGRLVDADGEPLGGQTVEVVEAFADGARNAGRRTALTTDADGRFGTRLAPGPSREVTAEFPGTRRLTRVDGRRLRLRVRAAVHLRASTARVKVGGPPVLFSGRVAHPEARLPASGVPVELEFRLPGMAWTEFRTVQTDRLGRFRYPYSFSDDDSAGVRFLFRAFVPAGGGWPFAPATSRPLAVTG
jgi:hypothetical protein